MRKLVLLAALLAAATVTPALAASEGSLCLRTRDIDHTRVVDAKTILFYMRDGKIWRNTLLNSCSGLLFNGFAYVIHYDQICGNQQSIRVLRTHEVCMLGPFSPEPPPHK